MPKETKTQGLTLLHHQGTREGCGNETLTLGEGRCFLGGNKKCCNQADRVVFFFPYISVFFSFPGASPSAAFKLWKKMGEKNVEC